MICSTMLKVSVADRDIISGRGDNLELKIECRAVVHLKTTDGGLSRHDCLAPERVNADETAGLGDYATARSSLLGGLIQAAVGLSGG